MYEPFFEAYIIRSFNDLEIRREVGVYLENRTRYRMTAQIVPPLSMLGETVNVWMAASTGDGKWLIRDQVRTLDGGSTGAGDTWYTLGDKPLKPCYEGYELSELAMGDNYINIVSWFPMGKMSGTTLYVGYGKSEETMFVSEPIKL